MAATKILFAGANVWRAPVGSTFPLDTLAYGATWLSPWVYAGYTNESLKFSAKLSNKDIMVQQKRSRLLRIPTTNDSMFSTKFVDWSANSFLFALGGAKTTVTAGTGQPGMEVFTYNTTIPPGTYAWGIEGLYYFADTGDATEGTARKVRIHIPSGAGAEGIETEIDYENEGGIPVTIAINEPSNHIPFIIRWDVADATG